MFQKTPQKKDKKLPQHQKSPQVSVFFQIRKSEPLAHVGASLDLLTILRVQ